MSNHQSSKPIKVLILQLFTNLKMVGKVESNTFARFFLVSNTECGGEMFAVAKRSVVRTPNPKVRI